MDIQKRQDDGVVYFALSGQFDTTALPAFQDHVDGLIERGPRNICVNFRDVTFINSTAIGYLVDAAQQLKDEDGELVFSAPSDFVSATVRTLGLFHIFDIYDSDRDAADHFAR